MPHCKNAKTRIELKNQIANIRTHLRVMLTDEERSEAGISDDRDVHICVMRALDFLMQQRDSLRLELQGLERVRQRDNEYLLSRIND